MIPDVSRVSMREPARTSSVTATTPAEGFSRTRMRRPFGSVDRVTRGLRASEPSAARDGAIAFSWRRPGGGTAIAVVEPGASEPRVLFEDPSGEPVASPRFSPSGDRIAFLHHRGGSWDVRIVPRAGGVPLDVTRGRAFDRDPAWSPDGRYLLFSSDRSGVFDIYALRLDDGTLIRTV